MGGIGKTELAYVVADKLRSTFPDAQLVLALRGTSPTPLAPEQALQTVIRAFSPDAKLPEDLPTLEALYRAQLHEKRALILADDAADAVQVRPLLPPPGSALLVTSRTRFTLPGMASIQLEQLDEREAVILLRSLCERLEEDEAQTLARACGYLPLALRVGGSILCNNPALPVAAYLARLADERQRLMQLRDPDDAGLDVEAALAVSYAQLDTITQRVFRQLGVFIADFTTELARAVVEAHAGVDAEGILYLLLRRNLVMYDTEHGRWRLHDLLRDLALHELEAAAEREATMWRYAQVAVQLAETMQAHYQAVGESDLAAIACFDAERPHIDAARRWALAHAGTTRGDALLVASACATRQIAMLRYDLRHEQLPYLEQALAAARRMGDRSGESILLNNLGLTFANLGEVRQAIVYFEQRLALAQVLDDRRAEGAARNNLGMARLFIGEARRTIPDLEQALTIARELGDARGESAVLNNLGDAYVLLGDLLQAIRCYEQDLTITQALSDRRKEGNALVSLGRAAVYRGEVERAIALSTQAQALAQELRDQRLEGYALSVLGQAYAAQTDQDRAILMFEAALNLLHAVSDRRGVAECNWQFGLALVQQGQRQRALALLCECVAYEAEIGHAQAAEHATLLDRLQTGQ
jgi:tetratricopeptide (TPR) repeat protein